MPKLSSLKELLARPAPGRNADRLPCASFVSLVLERRGPLHEPVSLAQALSRRGLGLRKAHDVLNRLAAGESVPVRLPASEELADLRAALAAFGVEVQPRQVPEAVDVQALREALGLTQLEFATRFGLDPAAVQNWEQGRTRPDRNARILLSVIAVEPRAVDAALSCAAAA